MPALRTYVERQAHPFSRTAKRKTTKPLPVLRKSVTFYHAGCPVCIDAERQLAESLDPKRFTVDAVHLGEEPGKLSAAEAAGVKSVPVLVMDGHPYHINFGASLSDLK